LFAGIARQFGIIRQVGGTECRTCLLDVQGIGLALGAFFVVYAWGVFVWNML
jgi:hypothetical protein